MDKYRSPKYVCPYSRADSSACASYFLGVLMRQMDSKGLQAPRPEVPFAGVSFEEVCGKVRDMVSPSWVQSRSHGTHCNSYGQSCNLNTIVKSLVNDIVNGLEGLNLEAFNRHV